MNPPRHAEHVRDVFRSSARGAWSCESGVVQSGEGPIPVLTVRGGERRRSRVPVGLRSQGGDGKELLGLGKILLLLEGEHRRGKSRGGLVVDGRCSASTVSSRLGITLSITFLPLANFAENKELLLGEPEKILKTALFLDHLGCSIKPWGYRGQQELRAPLLQ